jgi:hypothetical protein
MNTIPVALFSERASAEMVRARLSQASIPAELHDEAGLQRFWFVSRGEAGVRVEVPADQFERSEQLLVDWEAGDGVLSGAIHCPECRSMLIEYPQVTRKSVLTNIAMGLSSKVGLIEKEYYCQECHFTWPRDGRNTSPARANGAPFYFIRP